jgi:hypothetical protein
MEYCSGPSLADRYKRQPLSVAEAVRTGIRISSAIATAHASGILHRDIKPGNVLTNDYGSPLLTDFGISSMVEDDLPTHTTTLAALGGSGSTTGSQSVGLSIPWSPPEMFDDDPKPDVRSDVFSLSATIWTLLAGRTPFEIPGKSNQSLELMGRIERGAITPMDRDDVPPELIAVLRKGMAVDRLQRYATALDFARALQAVELSLSYAPTPIEVPNVNQVEAPVRPPGDDGADRTRVRGVTPVIAQPTKAPAPSLTPPPLPSEDPTDRTRMRGPRVIAPDTAAPHAAAPLPDATVVRSGSRAVVSPDGVIVDGGASRRPRRRGALVAVVIGVFIVVAVVVVIAVFVPRGSPSAGPSSTGGAPIDIGSAVPTPVISSAALSADSRTATFTWTDPDPVKGDSYVWQRTDGAGGGDITPTTAPTAVITGVTPGTNVCVEVSIVRSGELSADPLKACTS